MTGIGMVLAFADAAAFSLLVLYNQEVLRLGPAGFGLLLAAGAVGGILGGLAAPALARRLAATGFSAACPAPTAPWWSGLSPLGPCSAVRRRLPPASAAPTSSPAPC
jgi:hypothetical protein